TNKHTVTCVCVCCVPWCVCVAPRGVCVVRVVRGGRRTVSVLVCVHCACVVCECLLCRRLRVCVCGVPWCVWGVPVCVCVASPGVCVCVWRPLVLRGPVSGPHGLGWAGMWHVPRARH